LTVVKWLHTNSSEEWIIKAWWYAKRKCHFDIINWLEEYDSEVYDSANDEVTILLRMMINDDYSVYVKT
jgi:hypothetical protein